MFAPSHYPSLDTQKCLHPVYFKLYKNMTVLAITIRCKFILISDSDNLIKQNDVNLISIGLILYFNVCKMTVAIF